MPTGSSRTQQAFEKADAVITASAARRLGVRVRTSELKAIIRRQQRKVSRGSRHVRARA